MKRCPNCAQDIQAPAIICKHCVRELAAEYERRHLDSFHCRPGGILTVIAGLVVFVPDTDRKCPIGAMRSIYVRPGCPSTGSGADAAHRSRHRLLSGVRDQLMEPAITEASPSLRVTDDLLRL